MATTPRSRSRRLEPRAPTAGSGAAAPLERRGARAGAAASTAGGALRLAGWGLAAALLLGSAAAGSAPPVRAGGGTKGSAVALSRPPLILGTNLGLFDSSDRVVTSRAAQTLLQRARVPIIRMPFRSPTGSIVELEALRAIQYIGAIPLVIVHGPTDAKALPDDLQLLALVRSVFGKGIVYVEFGNEPNLLGIGAQRYAAAWNQVIPALAASSPTYRFVGPALSVPDPAYIATFDRLAKPRPYANSWHEYACVPSDTDGYCLRHLASWTADIERVNAAVGTAIGTTLPVMFTEWNLDAQPDPRWQRPGFMRSWTELALKTLGADVGVGLLAALQYCVSNNGAEELIGSGDRLTPEGQVFFQALRRAAASRPALDSRVAPAGWAP